jgi:transposase-like protein
LTPEQQREIARLYGETGSPIAEIRDQFGIGESSLYRVLQKQGVALRGRGTPAVIAVVTGGLPTAPAPRPRGRPRGAASVGPRVRGASRTAVTQDGAAPQFRVRFKAQRVFDARDIRDALRQAAVLGATEIVEVWRLD